MRLEFKNIHFQYPGSSTALFKDLNFQIEEPGFHALFGPSGVGKTTLAKMITGDINSFRGQISTHRIDRILYTYNLERLPGWSTVHEHFELNTPAPNRDRLGELLNSFGLQSFMHSRFAQLSLGQQNRTNLTRYLLQDFDLLIMDESLANVDEKTKENIILKIKSMFPDRCFLYISHNVVEVSKFCRQILVLRDQRREPQTLLIQGQDFIEGQPEAKQALERTMLEIVHAS